MNERVFKRKIYQRLKEWKEQDNGSTALLIEGARRVGKSTIVEEFARNEYETYLLIDFTNTHHEYSSHTLSITRTCARMVILNVSRSI